MGSIHLYLADGYQKKNMLAEARSHYLKALAILNEENINRNLEKCLKATTALNEILLSTDTESQVQPYVRRFKCFRSKPPSVKEIERMSSTNSEASSTTEHDSRNVVNSKLLSAPGGIVRLKDTGSTKTGFTLEVTRNVSAGNLIYLKSIKHLLLLIAVNWLF